MHESEKWKGSRSVVSDPQRHHGLQPSRLLHPWDFPGKSTGVGYHCLACEMSANFAIRVVSSTYLRLLMFLLPILIPACNSSSLAFLMMCSVYRLHKQGDSRQPRCTPFSILNIHWKDWCWSSSILVIWCEQRTHWKSPWCWERLRAEGEEGIRGWDGWMASPMQAWTWENSERWWGLGGLASQSWTWLGD